MRLYTEWMFLIEWESFPGKIANEAGARLFVQSFRRPSNGVGLQEDAKVCLRSCMLHSVPPPPPGGNRLEALLRDNLALSSFSELIAVVVDLAKGHAYIGGNIVVNRPVVIESLIPRLVDLTGTLPCQQCFHPHIKCQCGGQAVPASYTPTVTTPPVYATSYTSTQPLPQSAAYGITPTMGYSTSYYTMGVNPQMSQVVITSSSPVVCQAPPASTSMAYLPLSLTMQVVGSPSYPQVSYTMAHLSYYPAYTASEVVASTGYSMEDTSLQAMSSSFYSLESYATQATASGGYWLVEKDIFMEPTPPEASSLPMLDPDFRRPAPPHGDKHLQPLVPQQSAPLRQAHPTYQAQQARPQTPYEQQIQPPKMYSEATQQGPPQRGSLSGRGRGILMAMQGQNPPQVGQQAVSTSGSQHRSWDKAPG